MVICFSSMIIAFCEAIKIAWIKVM
jgi:hypothetical protein